MAGSGVRRGEITWGEVMGTAGRAPTVSSVVTRAMATVPEPVEPDREWWTGKIIEPAEPVDDWPVATGGYCAPSGPVYRATRGAITYSAPPSLPFPEEPPPSPVAEIHTTYSTHTREPERSALSAALRDAWERAART